MVDKQKKEEKNAKEGRGGDTMFKESYYLGVYVGVSTG